MASWFLILSAWLWASLLAARMRLGKDTLENVAFGAAGALVALCWLPFIFGLIFGFRLGAWLSLVALICGAGWEIKRTWPLRMPSTKIDHKQAALLTVLVIGLVYFGIMQWTHGLQPINGGYQAGGEAWEDQNGHTAIALTFAYGDNLQRLEYPFYSGWPMGYPFLPDYLTGVQLILGGDLSMAVWLGMFFASVAFLLLGYILARDWSGSRAVGVGTVVLALLAGGFGFWHIGEGIAEGKPIFELLRRFDYANDYSHNIHYHNLTTAVLLIMRTSVFGMPIAFAALLLLSRAAEEKGARSIPKSAVAAGFLAGALPMIHAHSFVVVILAACLWVPVWRVWNWRVIASFALPSLLALPQLLWTRRQLTISTKSYIEWHPGWMGPQDLAGIVKYWTMNGGLFFPLAFLSWFLAAPRLRRHTAPLMVLLPLGVFVVFQPNDYDNIKLFAYFNYAGALLAAMLMVRLWKQGPAGRFAAVPLTVAISLTGLMSVIHEWNSSWRIAEPDGLAFAAEIRAVTPPGALLLTGSRITHPASVYSGRRVLLGYHGWLGNFAMPFEERRDDVLEIYSGGLRAEELLRKYAIDYVVIGPPEREEFPNLNQEFFSKVAVSALSSGDYTLYRIR